MLIWRWYTVVVGEIQTHDPVIASLIHMATSAPTNHKYSNIK